jgi:hypothetical protein
LTATNDRNRYSAEFYVVSFSTLSVAEDPVNREEAEALAALRVRRFGEQTSEQLQKALRDAKVFDLNIDMQAPRIIIPEDATNSNTNVLMIDLGRLNLSTTPSVAASELVPAKQNDFYDEFSISLTKAKAQLIKWNERDKEVKKKKKKKREMEPKKKSRKDDVLLIFLSFFNFRKKKMNCWNPFLFCCR